MFKNKNKGLRSLILAGTISTTCLGLSQAALIVGDIAIIGFKDASPDGFSIAVLNEISAGEQFFFVDGRVDGTAVVDTEDVWRIEATSTLAAGTVIEVTDGGSVWNTTSPVTFTGIAGGIYSDGTSSATIVSSDGILLFDSTDNAATTANSTNLFYIDTTLDNATPAGLTDALGRNVRANGDDHVYKGPTTGSAAQLFASISDDTNWTTNSNAPNTNNGVASFTITTAVPEPSSAFLATAGLGLLAFRRKRKS